MHIVCAPSILLSGIMIWKQVESRHSFYGTFLCCHYVDLLISRPYLLHPFKKILIVLRNNGSLCGVRCSLSITCSVLLCSLVAENHILQSDTIDWAKQVKWKVTTMLSTITRTLQKRKIKIKTKYTFWYPSPKDTTNYFKV